MSTRKVGGLVFADVATTANGDGVRVEMGFGECVTIEAQDSGPRRPFKVLNGPALRDALLEVFPLKGEKGSPEPEDHPHDDGFKQLVDRATEAAAKAAGKAYLEAYAKAFSAALVEDQDRPLQVGDRVELVKKYGGFPAGTRGRVLDIAPVTRSLAKEGGLAEVRVNDRETFHCFASRLRRVP